MSVVKALVRLRPGAEWSLRGDNLADLVWHSPGTPPTIAEIEAEIAVIAANEPMELLREERNRLLAETDWWATSDRTMTAEQAAYRQALRDLPANTADPSNPAWPVKPGV